MTKSESFCSFEWSVLIIDLFLWICLIYMKTIAAFILFGQILKSWNIKLARKVEVMCRELMYYFVPILINNYAAISSRNKSNFKEKINKIIMLFSEKLLFYLFMKSQHHISCSFVLIFEKRSQCFLRTELCLETYLIVNFWLIQTHEKFLRLSNTAVSFSEFVLHFILMIKLSFL
jgi:hypothetical protein